MKTKKPDIDKIVDFILEGKTYRDIAKELKMALTTLHDFTSKPEHSARVKEALQYSASTYADKAEQVLIDIKKTSTQVEMYRARELAQHYRWKASKRSPKKYGDKVGIDLRTPEGITVNYNQQKGNEPL